MRMLDPFRGCPEGARSFVVKAALAVARPSMSFHEKTMCRGKDIRSGDRIFVFASDHEGGSGLTACGIVTSVRRGLGSRRWIAVKRTATARRKLGRPELATFRELADSSPQTEIARKLYRQATNKIAGVSPAAAKFLSNYF